MEKHFDWIAILGIIIILILIVLITKNLMTKKDGLKNWVDIATIFGSLATALTLIWAAYTYIDSVQKQHELSASDLYKDQMKLSIEHPEFSNPKTVPDTPGRYSNDKDAIKNYEQYRWYVGYTFYTFDAILASSNDNDWKITMRAFFKDHKDYIITDSVKLERFTYKLDTLVNSTLANCKICDSIANSKKPN